MEIIEVNEKKEGTDIDYYNNVSNPASFSQTNKRCCHISGHCWLCTNNKGKLNKQTNKQNFQAADYWASVPTTIDGMLGGFAKISHTDIDGSNKLLKSLFKVEVMTPHISWFCNNNSPTVFRKGGGRSRQRKSPGLWCWHWKDHETPPDQGEIKQTCNDGFYCMSDQGEPKHLLMLCGLSWTTNVFFSLQNTCSPALWESGPAGAG